MRMMKKTMVPFDKKIYHGKPIYITSDKYWDGGITAGDSLKTKAEFYEVAHQMTSFIKRFISHLKEDIYIGQQYCEYNQLYANWSDLRKHELFRIISSMIQKKRIYQLSLPEDSEMVDIILESNFRYYTYVSMYLPKNDIIIQPTCHTEMIIYATDTDTMYNVLTQLIGEFPQLKVKL